MADQVYPGQVTLHKVNKAVDEALQFVFSGDGVSSVGWKTQETKGAIDMLFLFDLDMLTVDDIWLRQLEINHKNLVF